MTLRKSFSFTMFVCVILLARAIPAYAEGSWQQGQQAFARADFARALGYFESAREAGQSGPAVHYNIGVCQYKLARYSDAKITFTLIARQFPRMRGLAEYNLGLVNMKLDDADAARLYFLSAYELSVDDDKLRTLSANMLLRADTKIETPAYWLGSFGFRAGFDDNVALRDDLGLPAGTSVDSPMVDTFVSLQGPFREGGHLRLDAAFYAVTYLDIHDFDQNALSVGAVYDWTLGGWHAEAGLYAAYGTLGGDGFDQTGSGTISVSRRLTPESRISVRYRYDKVGAARSIFSGIEGSRQRLSARYRWSRQHHNMSLRYTYETNDRTDSGVSPDRHNLRFDYQYQPGAGLGYEAGGQLRNSDYSSLSPVRQEDLVLVYVGITKTMRSNWQILGQFQYSDNDASDPQFSYQRKVFTIGLLKNF